MFKGQKTLAALAISLLFASPVFAADEGSGEIHFKGEVTTSHINREHHSEKKPVNIRLINCDIAGWDDGKGGMVSKVGVTFDSTAKTTGATPLLSNISAGEATGVGVRLMNKDESFVVLGTEAPSIDLLASSTEQTLNFFAWMEQMDNAVSVTAGAVTANATYVLDYQ
ncbi:TPA: type 1 fimbrial protein [Escherichia coli]|nr:type 1 fimbrial protein [Escherichia coli]